MVNRWGGYEIPLSLKFSCDITIHKLMIDPSLMSFYALDIGEMNETTEEAVLLALETRDDLFESLYEMLSSDNYVRVLMALEEGITQTEIADEVGVGGATVSRAVNELKEYDLIEETDDGYRKTLTALGHPMIQHFYETEVLNSD